LATPDLTQSTVGVLRKLHHRGGPLVDWIFTFHAAAYNLVRLRRLLAQAADHLAPNGVLVAEIGANRKLVEKTFPRLPFTWLATRTGEGLVFLLRRAELATRR